MAYVSGKWDVVVKSPMGDEAAVLTVDSSGDAFKGTWAGSTGTTEIDNGKVDGDKLSWTMHITVPTPMTLDCQATVSGSTMTGTVTAGNFGTFPLTGTRS